MNAPTPSTSNAPLCRRCHSPIPPEQGYLVYSDAIEGVGADFRSFLSTSPTGGGSEEGDHEIQCLGSLMYCAVCANNLFTTQLWAKAKALRIEIDSERALTSEWVNARCEAIDFSVALRARGRNLDPPQARVEARELANMWWGNREEAELAAKGGVIKAEEKTETFTRWLETANVTAYCFAAVVLLYGVFGNIPSHPSIFIVIIVAVSVYFLVKGAIVAPVYFIRGLRGGAKRP